MRLLCNETRFKKVLYSKCYSLESIFHWNFNTLLHGSLQALKHPPEGVLRVL